MTAKTTFAGTGIEQLDHQRLGLRRGDRLPVSLYKAMPGQRLLAKGQPTTQHVGEGLHGGGINDHYPPAFQIFNHQIRRGDSEGCEGLV